MTTNASVLHPVIRAYDIFKSNPGKEFTAGQIATMLTKEGYGAATVSTAVRQMGTDGIIEHSSGKGLPRDPAMFKYKEGSTRPLEADHPYWRRTKAVIESDRKAEKKEAVATVKKARQAKHVQAAINNGFAVPALKSRQAAMRTLNNVLPEKERRKTPQAVVPVPEVEEPMLLIKGAMVPVSGARQIWEQLNMVFGQPSQK